MAGYMSGTTHEDLGLVPCLVRADRSSAFIVDRVKIFLTWDCRLNAVQNLVVLSRTVRAHVGGSKISGDAAWGPAPLERRRACPTIDTRYCPSMCYRTEFRRCRSIL